MSAETTTVRAPVFLVRCPVHRSLVAQDGEHRLLGRCEACVVEAQAATRLIRRKALA